MKYARIEISKKVFEKREKSVPITIFARFSNQSDEVISAPKSKIIIEREYQDGIVSTPRMQILVPMWIFARNHIMVTDVDGYIELVEVTA